MKKSLIFILLFSCLYLFAKDSNAYENQKIYVEKFSRAFELQSIGLTTNAFYVFKDAYKSALMMGERKSKIDIINNLFIWYRKNGWSLGLMYKKSCCLEELCYEKSFSSNVSLCSSSNIFEPLKDKNIREFLCGSSMFISGVFCIVVNPPILGRVGYPLVVSGFRLIFNSLNEIAVPKDHRLVDLYKIQNKAKEILDDH